METLVRNGLKIYLMSTESSAWSETFRFLMISGGIELMNSLKFANIRGENGM